MRERDAGLIAGAREAAGVIAPQASRFEHEGKLSVEAAAAMGRAGLYKALVPRAFGGLEASPSAWVSALETVARADGAAGWCAMIGSTAGLVSAFVDEAVAREVYGPDDALSCGVFAPTGKARCTDAGLVVSGRWSFGSFCDHAQWRMGGVLMLDQAGAVQMAGVQPDARCVLFAPGETRVEQNWDVLGMRGTGSHDLVAAEVLVPEARCFSLTGRPTQDGPLYRLSVFGLLASGVAAVAVGVAQAALDRFVAMAREKVPAGSRRTLAHRELTQAAVASAEARVRGARALLRDAADEALDHAERHGPVSLEVRCTHRLASCHAAREARAAVSQLFEAAGAGAIRASEPLQRHLRDVHVAAQHMMVSEQVAVTVGRARLGLETDASLL